ncbi:TetR/AcrR family transcriptional regulator (plasmid) [Arthrobacter sp. TES]|jgi:AcrR family transcriptional regulator|uniref:Transcriptional regulator TetR/AcrR family n=3 Tax=Micrococcales TaxID=85006 RepID=Q6SKD0_PAEAU|nr:MULTISPECIES: TetR/AcrR family transcriptional regulator [Bacteria]AAS20042.1 transcriptional regulator TetR/AcrR family [Paenarthrobacter aurescens]AOY73557.1 putative transcriptional regulator [Arthrobacter sp. ZXY-2]ERI35183.1 hypothetical protein M707_23100 [Arthrobacter sp. AK-YN10]QOI65891.1 TetR/AcrR family transcriptional regulator [Arthrobacter sp. TES]AAK50277.1 putative transcriptional regulator [Pseudomonas sp. ADP]
MTKEPGTRALETRKRIIAAALELTLRQGESGITMTEIYKLANISRTSLYRHFSTVEEILTSIYLKIRSEFESGLQNAIEANPSAENRLDVVTDYLHHFFTSDLAQKLSAANTSYLKKLSLISFDARVDMYKKVLGPYFDIAEQQKGAPVDRDLVAYFITHYYASMALYGGYGRPEAINLLLKKLITGLSMV